MATPQNSRRVHLVGSVPLANARAVLEAVSTQLGTLVTRIPDGETGDRTQWVQFQLQSMESAHNLTKAGELELMPGLFQAMYRIVDPRRPVVFGALRYAREAKESYRQFAALKQEGRIGPSTRFQVALPTPLAVIGSFVELNSQRQAEAAYEARMLVELDEIVRDIPSSDLAIQWDIAWEMIYLEGWSGISYFDMSRQGFVDRICRLANAVPAQVELGFHLCYGDPGHKHLIEPRDLGRCVAISNELSAGIGRPIDWIHLPVPRDRQDAAFVAPLRELELPVTTEIFLGLIHLTDGLEGARARIAAASSVMPNFGIATECGFGRRPPSAVMELLALHKAAASMEAY